MKDIEITISSETSMVYLNKSIIGNDGENLQGNLVFKFKDNFVNGIGRLETLIGNNKAYLMLYKKDEEYYVPIKSVITKKGEINLQLVITEEESELGIPIFKSNTFKLYCNQSINAKIEMPDKYPQWIEYANQKMIRMEQILSEAEQMEREALQLDADVRELENDIKQVAIDTANVEVEIENLTNNINRIASDVSLNTDNINGLERNYNILHNELLDQEESLNHLEETKINKQEVYTKEQIEDKIKGYATTSSLISGINSCEPKLAETVDYVIETGYYGNGESGYRKYKNGLIEQWGVATTQASETEFTMHKPHINQNFSIFVEPREQGNFYHYAIPSANQKFKCRIQSRDNISMAIRFQWKSFGRWK